MKFKIDKITAHAIGYLKVHGTLMQIWKSTDIFVKDIMPKVSNYNSIFFFSYARPRYIKCLFINIQKQNNMLKKVAYFLRKTQTSRVNNSRILRIKNAKFSGYCLYINPNILWNFQICISVPLRRNLLRFEKYQHKQN